MKEERTRRPTGPGEIIMAHYLEPLKMSITELAARLGVSRKTVSAIVNGRAAVSVDMAMRLSRAFSTTPELWLNMQRALDLWQARQEQGGWRDVAPIPLAGMDEATAQE